MKKVKLKKSKASRRIQERALLKDLDDQYNDFKSKINLTGFTEYGANGYLELLDAEFKQYKDGVMCQIGEHDFNFKYDSSTKHIAKFLFKGFPDLVSGYLLNIVNEETELKQNILSFQDVAVPWTHLLPNKLRTNNEEDQKG